MEIKKAAAEMTAEEAYMLSPLTVPKNTATGEKGEKLSHAFEKIEGMKVVAGANNEYFCVPLLNYLSRRIEESDQILDALLQTHKSWTKLWDYVSRKIKAQPRLHGGAMNCVAMESSQVFSLVDEYLLKDDLREVQEEERKRKESAEKRKNTSSSLPKKSEEKKGKEEKTIKAEEPSLFDLDLFD